MIFLVRGYEVIKTYVIAEAGVNHNGDLDMAFKLVEKAAEVGADAIKFQTYKAEKLVTKEATKAEYQSKATGSDDTQLQMLKDLELKYEDHFKLIDHCRQRNIDFLSTAFDIDSLKFLSNDLGLGTLKIPSGELTNIPILIEFAKTGCEIIISSGMSDTDEIRDALGALSFGFLQRNEEKLQPSRNIFTEILRKNESQQYLSQKVTLLHCLTEYPAPIDEINLNAIQKLRDIFNIRVGYSDHTEGILASLIAVSHGATIIEKHLTLDKNLPGPDHKASLEPEEFKLLINQIRLTEKMMGDGKKRLMPSEVKNVENARKSIIASSKINKGETFTHENLSVKRPGSGISPIYYWDLLGMKAERDYETDDLIEQ